jgi:hypothetical protein
MSPGNGPHRPEPPELPADLEPLLLEAALGEGVPRASARRRLESDLRGLRELRALEARLAKVQGELAAAPGWDPAREPALVERILAETTRALPPLDARPWWLSFGAAAVLAGSGALALWLAGHGGATEPGARSTAKLDTALLDLDTARHATDAGPEGFAAAREESETTASDGACVAGPVDADARLEVRLLEARAKGLREQRWAPWVREVSPSELGSLALALWCEVQLDRYALSGERPPAWKHVVEILHVTLDRPETPRESSKLLAHALDRSRDYGLTGEVTVARLDTPGPLWTGEWFDDLAAAGREAGVAESGLWRTWVDQGRR